MARPGVAPTAKDRPIERPPSPEAAARGALPPCLSHPGRYLHVRKATLRGLAVGFLALLCLIVATHPLWLTAVARFLYLNEPPRPADAILVLGGGEGEREEWAAHLYFQGYAPLLITSGEVPPRLGEKRTFAEISRAALLEHGVPTEAILMLPATTSTYDEARQSRALMESWGARTLLVISDPYHMRRAVLTFRKVYRGSPVELVFVSTPTSWFRFERWWTRERELLVVFAEYQKLAFYLLEGRLW